MQSRSSNEVKERIRNKWNQLLRSSLNNISENMSGGTPPSVFVSSYFYPKVNIGPLISTFYGENATLLDYPEGWAGKKLEDVISYKLSLIRGTRSTPVDVHMSANKYIESLQELSMANKSPDIEVVFDKKPIPKFSETMSSSVTDSDPIHYGLVSKIKELKIPSGIKVDKRIEKVYYDKDLNANEAINTLYKDGTEVSKLIKIMSMGMLGSSKKRKIVPTKWSITAIDQIISSSLIKKLTNYSSIDEFKVHSYTHLGNYFAVILIPEHEWSFEMHEAWLDNRGNTEVETETEIHGSLNNYPKIGGSYFAARLAISEYLDLNRKKAAAIVIREIYPEYVLPVGVWQIREGLRKAMKNKSDIFDNLDKALDHACMKTNLSKNEWSRNSKIMKSIKHQKRLSDYF